MASSPAIMTGLLIAFMEVIAVNSVLNYTAITLLISSVHWFMLSWQSTHTQLCSDEVSSIQVSVHRSILLNSRDNTKLRTESDGLIYKKWYGSQNSLKDCFMLLERLALSFIGGWLSIMWHHKKYDCTMFIILAFSNTPVVED